MDITYNLLLKVHKTVTEMLYDRGFDVNKENELDIDLLKTKYRNIEEFDKLIYKKYDNNNNIIDEISIIYFKTDSDKKIGTSIINDIVIDAKTNNINHILFIVPIQLSNQSIQMIEKIKYDTRIEVFNYKQLAVNITKNIYVPKYTLLDQQEIQNLIVKYKINNLYNLPKMSLYDPISRYYDYKIGDVIMVDRKRKIMGTIQQVPTYRLIIETN